MNVSKISITNFKRRKDDTKREFTIKPNNPNKDKSDFILNGLIASGMRNATAILKVKNAIDKVKEKNENQADTENKNDGLNNQNIDNTEETAKEVKTANEDMAPETVSEETIKENSVYDDEIEDSNSEIKQDEIALSEAETVEDVEENGTTEEDSDISIVPNNSKEIREAILEEEPFVEVDEESKKDDITENNEEIPEYNVDDLDELTGLKEREKTKEEIHEQRLTNHKFIKGMIKENKALFNDFGVDPKLLSQLRKLDPELVKEITDPEFLSILLAPSEEIRLSYAEATKMYPIPSKFQIKLEKTVLKNTRMAKNHRKLARKFSINSNVKSVKSTNERLRRIKELGKTFSPEDLHKIFSSSSKGARKDLLNWLLEFHTASKDEQVFDNLEKFLDEE